MLLIKFHLSDSCDVFWSARGSVSSALLKIRVAVVCFRTGPQCACITRSHSTHRLHVCVHMHMHMAERGRVCACLFSSLNMRVIVRGPSRPEAQPFAIFIVGNAASVKSN